MHFLGSVQIPVRAIHRCGVLEADLQVRTALDPSPPLAAEMPMLVNTGMHAQFIPPLT